MGSVYNDDFLYVTIAGDLLHFRREFSRGKLAGFSFDPCFTVNRFMSNTPSVSDLPRGFMFIETRLTTDGLRKAVRVIGRTFLDGGPDDSDAMVGHYRHAIERFDSAGLILPPFLRPMPPKARSQIKAIFDQGYLMTTLGVNQKKLVKGLFRDYYVGWDELRVLGDQEHGGSDDYFRTRWSVPAGESLEISAEERERHRWGSSGTASRRLLVARLKDREIFLANRAWFYETQAKMLLEAY